MESITLQVGNSIISSGDALGQIQFAAPAESDGGASRYIVGRVYGEAEGAFSASSNPASIVFATSAADNLPASGKIKISHEGHILPLLDNSYDLGSPDLRFRNLYVTSEVISPTGVFDYIYFDTNVGDINLIEGQMNWNSEAGTVEIGLTDDLKMAVGQSLLFRVKNSTGTTLSAGQAVYASGVLGGGQIIQAAPFAVDNTVPEVRFIGLVTDDILNGEDGYVNNFGHIKNVDLRSSNTALNPNAETWTVGDILFVDDSTPGGLTKVQPQDDIYVALVLADGQNGELFVRITDPGHINDLHDVSVGNIQTNDMLVYNAASGSWINTQISDAALQGVQGITGSQGVQGLQGLTGSQGGTGIQGVSGTQGTQGVQGLIGSQGIQGIQGIQGTQGIQGLSTAAVSTGVPPNPYEGLRWFNSQNGKEYIYYDGFWVQTGSSFTGEKGIQGIQGITGSQGTTGSQGATGTQGLQGVDGFINTVVSTGIPTSPTEGMRWFNTVNGKEYVYYDSFWVQTGSSFTGERGVQGVQGITGPQGTTGSQGTTGTQGLQGLTNTSIVSTGVPPNPYEGMRWFNSENGNEYIYYDSFWVQTGSSFAGGARGLQGIQGVQGNQGVQGLDGLFAAQGIQGIQGPAGSGVLGSGVAEHIAYWTSSEEISYDTSLYWDSSNNRMGIGTTPEETLHIGGNVLSNKLYLEKLSNPSISSSTLTLDLNESQLFLVSLNSNITTLNINNTPTTSGVAVGFSIIFTADGTARTVTWPSGVQWPNASSPTLTSTNGKKDVLSFVSPDNGTSWLGFVGGQNF